LSFHDDVKVTFEAFDTFEKNQLLSIIIVLAVEKYLKQAEKCMRVEILFSAGRDCPPQDAT
jgi:hypothetical protein